MAGTGSSINVLSSIGVRAEMRARNDKSVRDLPLFANESCFSNLLQGRALRERPSHKAGVYSHFALEMVCPFVDNELLFFKTSQELYDAYLMLRNILKAMFRDSTLFPLLFQHNLELFNDRNPLTGFTVCPFHCSTHDWLSPSRPCSWHSLART